MLYATSITWMLNIEAQAIIIILITVIKIHVMGNVFNNYVHENINVFWCGNNVWILFAKAAYYYNFINYWLQWQHRTKILLMKDYYIFW